MGYSTTTFNSLTLNIENINVVRRQKTIKQRVGYSVAILGPGLAVGAIEHVLTLKGRITGANKDTIKASLENTQDGQRYAYNDGEHSGDYAILSLEFNDVAGIAGLSSWDYTMTIVEW